MEEVGQDEGLWRGVFDSKRARRAEATMAKYRDDDEGDKVDSPQSRHLVIAKGFEERHGVRQISVDRLDCADLAEKAKEGDELAKGRPNTSRELHGWLVLKARHARQWGREVVSSPLPGNPGHADIVLPAKVATNRDERRQHAQQLASYSKWMRRPARL